MFFKKKYKQSSSSLSKEAWSKFSSNSLGMTGLIFIMLISFIGIFAYVFSPDKTTNANTQTLEITAKKPGFKQEFLRVPVEIKESKSYLNRLFNGRSLSHQLIPIDSFWISGEELFIEIYTGLTPNNGPKEHYALSKFPSKQKEESSINEKYLEENGFISTKRFYLGTDRYGRDLLSRIIIGSRVSLAVGFIAVIISLLIGLSIGSVAGYFGGRIDQLIMWLINVVWSIPTLLLVIAITFALGRGFWQVFVAVGLTMWVEVARVTRGQIMSLREKEYVEAGVALGFSHSRIIFRHILPNVMAPIIVICAANFASAILIEAGLSFLGIGVQPPMPSWGGMIKDHYSYIILDSAHLAIIPGIAIMLLVFAFMIVGNALRDALDVKNS